MNQMKGKELDKHLNPEKYLSDAEKKALFEKRLAPLERRQFKLAAFEEGFLKSLEDAIENIEDPKQKGRISIEYIELDKFYRTSEALIFMLKDLVNMTDDQINEFWLKGSGFIKIKW